jgi:two-component system, sensor histidine kinase RpfC
MTTVAGASGATDPGDALAHTAFAKANLRQESKDEAEQARVRVVVGVVAFGACHLSGAPDFWPPTIFYFVYSLAVFGWLRLHPEGLPARRLIAIFGDVTTCTWALMVGGETTMWVYMIYHFILTGNSCRFGKGYFWFNEFISLVGFAAVITLTPAWNAQMHLSGGLFMALVILPLYTHFFVERFRRRDRLLERQTVQHEEQTKARSQFVASISHDIRTSLTGMKGAGEILLRLATSNKQRQTLTIFESSYRTLNTLLQDLLDVSRLEANKLTLLPAPFDLHESLRDVQMLFAERARDKGVDLRVLVSPAVGPFLMGDASRIERILMNLMGNAIKFTEHGYVSLLVADTDVAGVIKFTVEDSGIGITPEIHPKIFDAFTQEDQTTTRKHTGAGLGLSIVRHLVELMQGRYGFTSVPGKGSSFWVELPLSDSVAVRQHPLTLRGIVSAYPGCPRDMLHDAEMSGITIIEQPPATGTPRRSLFPDTTLIASIVRSTPDAVPGDSPVTPRETPTPLTLIYDPTLRKPIITPQSIAMPLVARWWTNAIRMEAIRRDAHLTLATPHEANAPAAYRNKRILIADDTATVLTVAEDILVADGYDVTTARNGKEALQLLLANRYDLAILDYHMPEMDGMQVIRHFRANAARTAQIPIIMLTASVSHETERIALAAGATTFLLKPFRANDLLNTIEDLLAASSAPDIADPDSVQDYHAQPPSNVVDIEHLQALRTAVPSPGFVRRTVSRFLELDAPDAMNKLESAVSAPAQRSLLHALAGSSATVGITRFSALCRTTMALPDNILTDTKVEWFDAVQQELSVSTAALAQVVDELEREGSSV